MEPSFGDPQVGTDYRFCLQTPGGSFVETAMSGSNWRRTRAGFRYSDVDGPVRRLWLQSTPHQVSISASVVSTTPLTLPVTVPVKARLIRLGVAPGCFEATFDDPSVNTARSFRAKE